MTAASPSDSRAKNEQIVFGGVFAAYTALSLLLYRLALRGPFLSDDYEYLFQNLYVERLSPADIRAILDPWGDPATLTANYAPVHLLLHGLEWQIFGARPLGYHVVNVIGHAVVATLLVALLRSARLSWAVSLLGGTFFLVHPANVEAVAWISQLKSVAALDFALAALLLFWQRPFLSTGGFVLGALAKATALLALPVVAVQTWTRRSAERIGWIALWVALVAAYALPQLTTFQRTGLGARDPGAGLALQLREAAALVGHYVVMAATSIGVSTNHEPRFPASWLDPWVVGGIAVVGLLTLRTIVLLVARREEAAWWTFAAAGFLPVSQVLPFAFPMADRYLYFILPGAIGALLLAAKAMQERLGPSVVSGRVRVVLFTCAAAALLVLAVRTHARAAIFSSGEAFMEDSAAHYPDGIQAALLRASRAARSGDREATLEAVEMLGRRGYTSVLQLQEDPTFAFVRDDPRFQAVIHTGAEFWIERIGRRNDPTLNELLTLSQAYMLHGEPEPAIAVLRRALVNPGPYREVVLSKLQEAEAAAVRGRAHVQERPAATQGSASPGGEPTRADPTGETVPPRLEGSSQRAD